MGGNLNGCMEVLVQGFSVSVHDCKTTLEKSLIQSQKINLQMILYLGEYGVGCLQCEILICSQCGDGIFIPKGKLLRAER